MSLAFLHKKSWHTANLKNVEQVWLSEQKQAEEDRKLEAWTIATGPSDDDRPPRRRPRAWKFPSGVRPTAALANRCLA